MEALAQELVEMLRIPPSPGGLRTAVEHMWGYVRDHVPSEMRTVAHTHLQTQFRWVQRLAREHAPYLWHQTALSEFSFWIPLDLREL